MRRRVLRTVVAWCPEMEGRHEEWGWECGGPQSASLRGKRMGCGCKVTWRGLAYHSHGSNVLPRWGEAVGMAVG